MISNITVWLDRTAERLPDKTAYADRNTALTFSEIKTQSMTLAGAMLRLDPLLFKKPVVVYMEKSVEVLVSFFAAAYSGNFYSPIDVTMPASRVEKIFEYLKPAMIITKSRYRDRVAESWPEIPMLCLEDVLPGAEEDEAAIEQQVLARRTHSCDTDLLYVLFTSGSTGIPKGVTITHRAVMDYIDCIEELFSFTEEDSFGNQAPFYFDNSILDIYTTMKTGATMHILPEELFAWPVKLLEYILEKEINTIFWVPSALIVVSKLRALKSCDMRGHLKRVLFCGEVMPNKQLNSWRRFLPDAVYANIYGPTEITDACTCYIVDREFADEEPLPIGKPMHNTDILVLDDEDVPVPPQDTEHIGELCVRGTSLSMGYYNNPDKTRDAFVQNPLNGAYPEIIYRTGDLVRYNEYGELLYLSRKDFQIKHMGHRIELGEIETAVSSLEEISLNCCLYDEKRSRIVLFIEGESSLEDINGRLTQLIPEYMLPGLLICKDKLPINANGKIDRVALKAEL